MRSDPTLKKCFNRLNKKWFHNSLPRLTKVYYSDELESSTTARHLTFGETDWGGYGFTPPIITINPVLREQGLKTIIIETLLHEMAHIEEIRLGIKGDHGPGWEKIMLRLAKAGAFSKHNGVVKNSLW